MFTIFCLKNSSLLTADEQAYLHRMLAAYSFTQNGLWLQSLQWEQFEFRWCPAMTVGNGILGCFTPLHPKTVFLQPRENTIPCLEGMGRVFWLEQLFPTVIHELCHARQWQKSKIGYLLCALPLLRGKTLEIDALIAGDEAEKFTAGWIRKQDWIISAPKLELTEKTFEEDGENEKS